MTTDYPYSLLSRAGEVVRIREGSPFHRQHPDLRDGDVVEFMFDDWLVVEPPARRLAAHPFFAGRAT